MSRLLPRPLKVERDFTDAHPTDFGGCSALALTAERLGFFKDLSEGIRIKDRHHGASDGLLEAARRLARRVAPAVIDHEVEERGAVNPFGPIQQLP